MFGPACPLQGRNIRVNEAQPSGGGGGGGYRGGRGEFLVQTRVGICCSHLHPQRGALTFPLTGFSVAQVQVHS